ncbi:MAG: hypothetical protein M1829_005959 [Trizodia sp. TS-e1964]|nr:MAG: hypothetical protein M1829_005959 [Trizodia sp. TS-e1964]
MQPRQSLPLRLTSESIPSENDLFNLKTPGHWEADPAVLEGGVVYRRGAGSMENSKTQENDEDGESENGGLHEYCFPTTTPHFARWIVD